MVDEKNSTAINRYSDLNFILSNLSPSYSEVDKENSLHSLQNLKVHSKPFKPSKAPMTEVENRSPLIDLSQTAISSPPSSIFASVVLQPNFSFLMP